MMAGVVAAPGCPLFADAVASLQRDRRWDATALPAAGVWLGAEGREAGLCSATGRAGGHGSLAVLFEGVLFDGPAPEAPGQRRTSAVVSARHVAAAYGSDGDAAIDRLTGDFACAVWDAHTDAVLLATDPFAQRPVYYAVHEREPIAAFAAHSRLLRQLPWVGNVLDELTIVDHLLMQDWLPGHTPLLNVRFLQGGHSIRMARVRAAPPVPRRYWGPHFKTNAIRSSREFLEAFEATFSTAVADRMADAGGSGTAILLSGGFDSTAVAGVAAHVRADMQHGYAPAMTVSGTFGTLPCDESARIAIASAYTGLPARLVPALELPLTPSGIDMQVRAADSPLFNMQDALLHAELDAADAAGADVILMGQGGDELTDDRHYARDLLAARGVRHLVGVARAVAPIRGTSVAAEAWALARATAPRALKHAWRGLRRAANHGRSDPATAWLQPAVRRTLAFQQQHAATIARAGCELATDSPWPASHWQRAMWRGLQRADVQYGGRATVQDILRRGFGYGAPFLDHRLFELVLATPPQWLPRTFDAGQYKPLIGVALQRHVPRELTASYWKADFESYNRSRMRAALDDLCAWLLNDGEWRAGAFVSRDSAEHVAESFRATHDAGHPAAHRHLVSLYGIVGLEAWLRQL